MALGGLGLFLLEAGFGTALLLLFFPAQTLGRGFFVLHGALAAAFLGGAYLVRPEGYRPGAGVASAALLVLYSAAAQAGWAGKARGILALGSLGASWSLAGVALAAPRPHGDAWTLGGASFKRSRTSHSAKSRALIA